MFTLAACVEFIKQLLKTRFVLFFVFEAWKKLLLT